MARVVEREADVGAGGVDQSRPCVGERRGEQAESLGGQRREQPAPVREVVRRRGVRDARGAGQFAQRDSVGAALGDQCRGLGEDRGLEIPVVVGVAAHPPSIAGNLDSG